jgi:hypothetical protein
MGSLESGRTGVFARDDYTAGSFGPNRAGGVPQDDGGLLYAPGGIRLAETNA